MLFSLLFSFTIESKLDSPYGLSNNSFFFLLPLSLRWEFFDLSYASIQEQYFGFIVAINIARHEGLCCYCIWSVAEIGVSVHTPYTIVRMELSSAEIQTH